MENETLFGEVPDIGLTHINTGIIVQGAFVVAAIALGVAGFKYLYKKIINS